MTDEQEPSEDYVKGYNHGYQMSKHEPELFEKLLRSQDSHTSNDYMKATNCF